MIAYLEGQVISVGDQTAVILAGSVGYTVRFSPAVFEEVQTAGDAGAAIKLWIHHRFTEAGQDLCGFYSKSHMDFFLKLLTVPKVGPRAALVMSEHKEAVLAGDTAALKALPGIGEKLATLVIRTLDIQPQATRSPRQAAKPAPARKTDSPLHAAVSAALTGLGYKPGERQKMIETVANLHPEITDEAAFIKATLQHAPRSS